MLHVQTTCSFINAPHDSPLPGGYTPGSDEGSMTLNGLTVLLKKLEHKVKSSKSRRRAKIVISDDEDNQEDPSKHGRKIAQIDEDDGITLFTAPKEVSTASPEVRNAAKSLVYIRRSATKKKDKGKAFMKEAKLVEKKTKQRIAKVQEEAITFNTKEWDNIQAQIEADEELAHRLQAQEREGYSEADKARLLIKHIGSLTLQQLKKLSFDEIKELFETTMKRVNTFTPMKSDDTVPKVVAGSSKRDAEQELNQESLVRQMIGEGSKQVEESKDELSQEQLQQLMIIVPEEWMNIFKDMLKNFDMDDLVKLWSLVHERSNSTEPIEVKERELWVELKRLFEPNESDFLLKLQ
ncbi:hypothetical protein Tco_1127049, partial [Tanacetum coccineum]